MGYMGILLNMPKARCYLLKGDYRVFGLDGTAWKATLAFCGQLSKLATGWWHGFKKGSK